jgi:hypothetical protein
MKAPHVIQVAISAALIVGTQVESPELTQLTAGLIMFVISMIGIQLFAPADYLFAGGMKSDFMVAFLILINIVTLFVVGENTLGAIYLTIWLLFLFKYLEYIGRDSLTKKHKRKNDDE